MTDLFIPASPNWYLSKASDLSLNGLFAFGTRNRIQILDFRSTFSKLSKIHYLENENPVTAIDNASSFAIFEAHTERLTAIVFSKLKPSFLCSGSDDGMVKIWELDDNGLKENSNEHSAHNGEKVLCVEWSPLVEDLVFSGDELGTVIIWSYNRKDNPLRSLSPEKSAVTCLASSPHNERYLVIGYQSSLVLVMDIGRGGQILHRLRGHDDEIQCVTWCPSAGEDFAGKAASENEDWRNEFGTGVTASESVQLNTVGALILTSSRDRTIRLWSLTSGKQLLLMRLPTNTGYRKDNFVDNKSRVWLTLHWLNDRPSQFVSSTHGGEMLLWDLRRPGGKQSQKWQVVDQHGDIKGHYRIIFNISGDQRFLMSIGLDRKICVWDMNRQKCVVSIHTCGGFVYCLASSSLMPGKLALGIGDQMIRVWNTSTPGNQYDINNLWQGIKSKVTCLSWHPSKEGVLAYGTEDGRVGVYYTLSGKPPSISSTFHKRTVYVVTWGPPCHQSDSDSVLYSVGDGFILQHDRKKLDQDAFHINEIIKRTNGFKHVKQRSEISWKPDNEVVAIGNDDGSVELFRSPDLKLLGTIHVCQKIINVIRWHPEHTTDDVTASVLKCWMAIGSNASDVYVVDAASIIEASDEAGEAKTVTESTNTLSYHKGRITALSWSPHQEGLLVSASYDGCAQVWDVMRGKPLVNFLPHKSRLLSAVWNPLDPDSVYTGGEDFCVYRWKISAQIQSPHPGPFAPVADKSGHPRTKNKRKRKAKTGAISVVREPDDDATSNIDPNIQNLLDEKRRELEREKSTNTSPADIVTRSPSRSENLTSKSDLAIDSESKIAVESNESKIAAKSKMAANADERTRCFDEEEKSLSEVQDRQKRLLESIGAKLHVHVEIPKNRSLDSIKSDTSKRRRPPSLFPFCNSMENRNRSCHLEDVSVLFNALYGRDISTDLEKLCNDVNFVHLGVFADMRALQTMLRVEENYLLEHNRVDQYLQIQVLRGDVSLVLESAAKSNHLSDWLISMSSFSKLPSYLSACEAYATYLESEELFMKAACYYLACHQVHKAVQLLLSHKLYREAATLSRLRLFRKDPKVNEIFTAWADSFMENNMTEQAAKCYLALHDPLGAAKLIGSRSDRPSLRLACRMMSKLDQSGFGEEGLLTELSVRYIRQCQLEFDWSSGMELVTSQSDMKESELELCVHQALYQAMVQLALLQVDASCQYWTPDTSTQTSTQHVPVFFLAAAAENLMLPWKPYSTGNQSFAHSILRRWLKVHQLNLSETEYLYQKILEGHAKRTETVQWKQTLLSITKDSLLALLGYLNGNVIDSTGHLLDAMATCYHGDHSVMLMGLCRLFFPNGPDYLASFIAQVQALRLAMSDATSTSLSVKPSPWQQSAINLFYWWNVVHDFRADLLLLSDESESENGDSNLESGVLSTAITKTAVKSPLKMTNSTTEAATGNASDCRRSRKELERFLTSDVIRSLLNEFFNVDLARKFAFDTILSQIDDSVRTLILSHRTPVKTETETNHVDTTKLEVDRPYTAMETTADSCASVSAEEINVEITSEPIEKTLPISELNLSSQENNILESPIVEIVNSDDVSFSKTPEVKYSGKKSINSNGDDEDCVLMEGPLASTVAERPRYPDVTSDWYDLPAEERYRSPALSLAILSMEKQYYQHLRGLLPDDVQNIPFPDVLQAIKELKSFLHLAQRKLTLKMDMTHFESEIEQWIRKYDTL